MNIALLGYGKMGRTIETLAQAAGHPIVLRIDEHNRADLTPADLAAADVAIEFSRPDAAIGNINLALEAGVPIVVGTTGWLAELPTIQRRVEVADGALFWASNFSVGVNIFFELAQRAAELLGPYGDDYRPTIEEIHHTQKLDAPSGTAITLAERTAIGLPNYESWELADVRSPTPTQRIAPATAPTGGKQALPITSLREPDVPGTHTLRLTSAVDTLELKHTAHSRQGFAQGALTAARWIIGRRGTFTMTDLLGGQ